MCSAAAAERKTGERTRKRESDPKPGHPTASPRLRQPSGSREKSQRSKCEPRLRRSTKMEKRSQVLRL